MTATNISGEPQDEAIEESQSSVSVDSDLQDFDSEAYTQLNQELDEISNCLDALETKNDHLHQEIFKLLEESKQIRSELKEPEQKEHESKS